MLLGFITVEGQRRADPLWSTLCLSLYLSLVSISD